MKKHNTTSGGYSCRYMKKARLQPLEDGYALRSIQATIEAWRVLPPPGKRRLRDAFIGKLGHLPQRSQIPMRFLFLSRVMRLEPLCGSAAW